MDAGRVCGARFDLRHARDAFRRQARLPSALLVHDQRRPLARDQLGRGAGRCPPDEDDDQARRAQEEPAQELCAHAEAQPGRRHRQASRAHEGARREGQEGRAHRRQARGQGARGVRGGQEGQEGHQGVGQGMVQEGNCRHRHHLSVRGAGPRGTPARGSCADRPRGLRPCAPARCGSAGTGFAGACLARCEVRRARPTRADKGSKMSSGAERPSDCPTE
mmetsp:Transcript_21606/g.66986  ORF Transcript_21606/g.66986 Transcript_21606/m.66986 type:complete len:220 (-) Transcript_21606:16-675(-)